jgi:diketogulonate reductase-like aldo/keto reductase
MIGFGTYYHSNEEASISVAYELSVGYRYIDTAEYYANHEGIALGIAESGICRSDTGTVLSSVMG